MPEQPTAEMIARMEKWFAAECNNRAWELASQAARTPQESDEMLYAAYAAAYHWSKAGTALHGARAEMTLAHMHSVRGEGELALRYARRCLAYFEQNPGEDWDTAFAHAELAFAAATAGDSALHAAHYAEALFPRRWSGKAMSGAPLAQADLLRLFEAARWAPSSSNRQEWFFLYAHRDTPEFEQFYAFLDEGNRAWCHRAAVLIVALSRHVAEDGREQRMHTFDMGMAFQNLLLQASLIGLVTRPLGGFDKPRAREELRVPEYFTVQCMLAVGHPGAIEDLPPHQQEREKPNSRKPVNDFIRQGGF